MAKPYFILGFFFTYNDKTYSFKIPRFQYFDEKSNEIIIIIFSTPCIVVVMPHNYNNYNDIPYSSKYSWHNIFVINPSFTKIVSTKINQCKATKIIGCRVHVVGGASRKCSRNFAAITKFLPRKLKLLLI